MPFNPQQNGVAERKNQTIVEGAMAMLHDKDLPMMICVATCNTTIYVQNNSPHKGLEEKPHEEASIGLNPEIGHLKIFGCSIYFHVPKVKRTKLDPYEKKYMFVGYSETSKAYRQ
jgi:hypothetical protein